MINISFYDKETSVTTWWFCLIFMTLAVAAPLAITILFWKSGPKLKDSYEKMPLLKSFWEIKPITAEVQNMLADIKA